MSSNAAESAADFTLRIRKDSHADFTQWFHFRLSGARDVPCTLRFENAGASKGLHYSIYSLGYATLLDGRVINVGGHNMQSNSGFRKLNIFDPATGTWAPRPVPCNIANWRNDPGGVALGYKAVADAAALAGGQPGSFGGVTDYVPAGDQLGYFGFQTDLNQSYKGNVITYGTGDTLHNMATTTCPVSAASMYRSFAFPAPCPAAGYGSVFYLDDTGSKGKVLLRP